MNAELGRYFSGEELYGNDFSIDEIEKWFEDEKEAYASLGSMDKATYSYGYHELNKLHAFDNLKVRLSANVLAFGAAYGDELLPIKHLLGSVTILDPSEAFVSENSRLPNVTWQKPHVNGELDFESESFDLITCLGVLHHIPNVELVLREIHRVLRKDGVLILREPVHSMGDWTQLRTGLTKRERGIPKKILTKMLEHVSFDIVVKHYCMFAPLSKFVKKLGSTKSIYNNRFLTRLDSVFSLVFAFNANTYHRTSMLQKIGPAGIYFVLRK